MNIQRITQNNDPFFQQMFQTIVTFITMDNETKELVYPYLKRNPLYKKINKNNFFDLTVKFLSHFKESIFDNVKNFLKIDSSDVVIASKYFSINGNHYHVSVSIVIVDEWIDFSHKIVSIGNNGIVQEHNNTEFRSVFDFTVRVKRLDGLYLNDHNFTVATRPMEQIQHASVDTRTLMCLYRSLIHNEDVFGRKINNHQHYATRVNLARLIRSYQQYLTPAEVEEVCAVIPNMDDYTNTFVALGYNNPFHYLLTEDKFSRFPSLKYLEDELTEYALHTLSDFEINIYCNAVK